MSKFCQECGARLDGDSTFCPSCGKSTSASLATPKLPPLGTIPDPVWAGVLQVFFTITTLIATTVSGVSGVVSSFSSSLFGSSSTGVWPFLLMLLSLLMLSAQAALASGLLSQRRWARPLYMWALGPTVIITILVVLQGDVLKGSAGFGAGCVWLALTAAQAYLVVRSEAAFTN
jgi:hypothetical protein